MSLRLRVKYVNRLTGLEIVIGSFEGIVPVATDVGVSCIERLRFIVRVVL